MPDVGQHESCGTGSDSGMGCPGGTVEQCRDCGGLFLFCPCGCSTFDFCTCDWDGLRYDEDDWADWVRWDLN